MVLHGCFDLPQKIYYTVALHAFVGGDAGVVLFGFWEFGFIHECCGEAMVQNIGDIPPLN